VKTIGKVRPRLPINAAQGDRVSDAHTTVHLYQK